MRGANKLRNLSESQTKASVENQRLLLCSSETRDTDARDLCDVAVRDHNVSDIEEPEHRGKPLEVLQVPERQLRHSKPGVRESEVPISSTDGLHCVRVALRPFTVSWYPRE
eukprot:3633768-Rhodomonas_salina.2